MGTARVAGRSGLVRVTAWLGSGIAGRLSGKEIDDLLNGFVGAMFALGLRAARCVRRSGTESLQTLRWRKADSNSRSHLTGRCQIRVGSPFVMLGGSALERARKPPRASEDRCGLGAGGCGGGSRFDPPDNVRPLQRTLWLNEAGRLPSGRDARPGRRQRRGRARLRLLSLLELFGPACLPFPAREAGWPPSDA